LTARIFAKRTGQALALALTFPSAALCGFGRLPAIYTIFAHAYALRPGAPGNFLRAAFYRWTLRSCSINTNIAFGTYFVTPDSVVEEFVSIGSYCVIGRCRIGTWTQIASHVEIPSGRHQHERDAEGQLSGAAHGQVTIGARCWIGASAIVMADVGDGSTIGAGAVVVKNVPAGVTAAGNPARIL
jgi:acetyltransferase-like isoleucine patch superfamily enzyme